MGWPHRLAELCATVLVLMIFGQVPARVGVLQIRRVPLGYLAITF
jgi:hypothetical protein